MTNNTDYITIYCKNNNIHKEVRIGSSLLDIYEAVGSPLKHRALCARVNNRVRSLTYRCWQPKEVDFVDYTDLSGYRAYIRSLCFILTKAVNDLFPGRPFGLEHPVSKGYYCTFVDQEQIPEEAIMQIKKHMKEIIAADMPFMLKTVRTVEAVNLFRERGLDDKALLLETTGMSYSSYYELDGYVDYFYGSLTPSAGFIQLFDIVPYDIGLLLRVPRLDNPSELNPVIRQDKMFNAYKRYLEIQRTVGLNNVGDLNRVIQKGRTSEVVMVSEAIQEKRISSIAEKIAERYNHNGIRVVLISGPSSSGKTTFCKRLQIQLITNLLHPLGISLDDYYVDREKTPRDENGNYDFESLYAIDLPYFKKDLQRLIDGEEVELPSFNFSTGLREYRGKKLKMQHNSILLLEGIHGLNPELTDNIPPERIFRVYVSALTTISLDGHNWIPTTDNRLLRRIVRDHQFRGYTAKQTISMWPSVRRGEDKWIFPYQENADVMFNSAMIYEFASLRHYAEPILNEVHENEAEYAEAYRLLRFLRYFNYIYEEELPGTSLLREFLGGGKFKY
ncbi:MAG: nucleoside kinase [Tannerella sp.]|jgi:uridine kinase|nr:nucleoside kinase [Tannerella sp.]